MPTTATRSSRSADSKRALFNADGIDVAAARDAKSETGELPADAGDEIGQDELLELDVDILAPSAMEDAITRDNADRIRADVVLEVANGPTGPDADDILSERGVTVVPDIVTNAGGVTVSYYEWVQNRMGLRWTAEQVSERLSKAMTGAAEGMWSVAAERDVPLRTAAYAIGLERISDAVSATGSAEAFQRR